MQLLRFYCIIIITFRSILYFFVVKQNNSLNICVVYIPCVSAFMSPFVYHSCKQIYRPQNNWISSAHTFSHAKLNVASFRLIKYKNLFPVRVVLHGTSHHNFKKHVWITSYFIILCSSSIYILVVQVFCALVIIACAQTAITIPQGICICINVCCDASETKAAKLLNEFSLFMLMLGIQTRQRWQEC